MLNKIDLTLLKPEASSQDIDKLIETAKTHKVFGVCVQPHFVKYVKEKSDLKVITVIGFPLGMNTLKTKIFETKEAIKDGADEIDMVINYNKLKEDPKGLKKEIKEISKICKKADKVLKVIVETSRLSRPEKILACELVEAGGADYIKTSTGFTDKGAILEDIMLFKSISRLKVKASGGVKEKPQFEAFISGGADRIGASSIDALLGKKTNGDGY